MRFAQLLRKGGKLREAVEEYTLASAADPMYSQPHTQLGLLHERLGQPQVALHAYETAEKLNPRDAKNLNNKARVLFGLGSYAAAAVAMEAALAEEPLDAAIWRNLGVLQRRRGEADKALEAFRTSLRLDPSDADGHLALGELAEE